MASYPKLPELAAEHVKEQVGPVLELFSLAPEEDVQIHLSLRVWSVTDMSDVDPSDPPALYLAAAPLGAWYHQLTDAGKPVGYVISRSLEQDSTTPEIEALQASPLIERIEAAIDFLEDQDTEGEEVRFLEFPNLEVLALWLRSNIDAPDRVLILDAPPELFRTEPLELITETQFLTRALSFMKGRASLSEPSSSDSRP